MITIATEIVIMEYSKIEILKKQKFCFAYVIVYNNIKYMIYITTFYQEKKYILDLPIIIQVIQLGVQKFITKIIISPINL
jgi:hypothetical protein